VADRDLDEQLTKYLTDAHCIEEQALIQMRYAPLIAGDPVISDEFREHRRETETHERMMRDRLHDHGAEPNRVKDVVGQLTGAGFALFALVQPDTPGKLVAHAFSYEHMELAAYELLARVAERAGDAETAAAAETIRSEEDAMSERLAGLFERAVDAALRAKQAQELDRDVIRYLTDAHALEAQASQLLARGRRLAGPQSLTEAYDEHLSETRTHEARVRERLRALGAGPSPVKDLLMTVGALNWGAFFGLQRDTPAKLAGFAYAFEHLEIAGYELLRRVAERAGDEPTAEVAGAILGEERAAAERIFGLLPDALDASLQSAGAA